MITQVIWTDVNNRELDSVYARSGDEEIREIEFIICRNDPPEKVAIPAGVSGQFRMVKSSGNFVVRDMSKTVHEDGTVIFTVAISDQMVNVQGTGYYDIRLSGGGYLYTASGRFIVDTPVISTSVLEDVSEVSGFVFPDDFLTVEDHVAIIDDDTVSKDSTWSSDKISEEIEAHDGGDVSKTVSGNPIEITDGAGAPLVKCVTQITGYQQGSGTPSPDNIRPIVAYTEGEIEVRGKNIFDDSIATVNGYIDDNGNLITGYGYKTTDYISIDPSTNYVGSGNANQNYLSCYAEYDANKNFIGRYTFEYNVVNAFTTSANAKYLRISGNKTNFPSGVQLEKGTTPTTYEPYTSTTHTTTFSDSIYQGEVDYVGGEVECRMPVIDLGSLTWQKVNTDPIRFYSGDLVSSISAPPNNDTKANMLCENYETVMANTVIGGSVGVAVGQSGVILIHDPNKTGLSTAEFKTAMSGVKVAYELATTTTSSVTTTNLPIKSLSGYTHIESSTGDMEVEYITERFQPLIDLIKQL